MLVMTIGADRVPDVGRGLPPEMSAALAALRERPIPGTSKGFGRIAAGRGGEGVVTSASLAARHPHLLGPDFMLPILVLREAALRHNIEAMASYCAAAGVGLAPHGKTTMAPQIIARQLAAGAWGLTAATIPQVQVFRAFGVPRILIANELTDRGGIEWLAAELAADPGFECYAYVDSIRGVALLDGLLRTAGFEGSISAGSAAATVAAVELFCRDLCTLGDLLPADPAGTPHLLSAGGSAFFDIVARELTAARPGRARPQVLLRSGAYVTHDHGHYAAVAPGPGQLGRSGPGLVPALELWATVLSRPEPGLAVASAGRRDVAFDLGLPVPLRIRQPDGSEAPAGQLRVTRLDDQHAYLSVPPTSPLAPGDQLCLGISHPCTTMDKWRVIPVEDGEYRVIDAVHTFF